VGQTDNSKTCNAFYYAVVQSAALHIRVHNSIALITNASESRLYSLQKSKTFYFAVVFCHLTQQNTTPARQAQLTTAEGWKTEFTSSSLSRSKPHAGGSRLHRSSPTSSVLCRVPGRPQPDVLLPEVSLDGA